MENAKLYEALAKAQSQIGSAKFNKVNPHYKNKYADLASVMEACKKPLNDNGLSILQIIRTDNDGKMYLVTRLAHISGEFVESSFLLKLEKNTFQGTGSAISYARRYSLSALLGIVADEDDDAEIALREEAQYITADQVIEISKKLSELKNGDRLSVLKAIGTNNINEIKADKYTSVCLLIDTTIQRIKGL